MLGTELSLPCSESDPPSVELELDLSPAGLGNGLSLAGYESELSPAGLTLGLSPAHLPGVGGALNSSEALSCLVGSMEVSVSLCLSLDPLCSLSDSGLSCLSAKEPLLPGLLCTGPVLARLAANLADRLSLQGGIADPFCISPRALRPSISLWGGVFAIPVGSRSLPLYPSSVCV